MKKSFIAMGLAVAAALCLSSCAKENAPEGIADSKGVPFEISASSVFTKTTNDGLNTKWAENDALTVFHAEAGTTTYGTNDKFTVTAAEATSFTGTLTEALDNAKSYDWYAIYPYSSYYTTPANTTCYQQIANNITQKGYNSTAHLAGNKFPLVGKAKAVPAGTTPNIAMKQICAVIKLVVTNNSGEELTVSTAAITSANVNLAGGYFINFAGDEPVLVDENAEDHTKDSYMFKTVSLTVNGGTAIANGGTATLYFGVKPFTAKNETLKLSVNGYEKDLVIGAEEVAFKAGHIKTVNFNFDKAIVVPDLTGDWLITGVNGENTYAMGLYSSGSNIKAITTPLAFVEGKVYETTSIAEAKVTITKIADGDYAGMYSIVDTEGKYLYAASSSSNHLKTQSTMNENSAWTITPDGDNYSIIATKSSNRNILRFNYNSGTPMFSCYSSGQTPVSLFPYSKVIQNTNPTLTLKKTAISDVSAAGVTDEEETGVYTLENAVDNDVTVTKDGTVVTAASISGGVLTYTVAANTGAAREGWVKLALAGQEAQTITVSQKAAPAGKETELNFTKQEYGNNAYSGSWTYGDWKIVNGANNNKGWTYVKMGGKSATLSSANPCYIYNTTPISHSVKKITVDIAAGSLSKSGMSVNSWGVYVYSDEEMTTQVDYVEGGTITNTAGSFDFTPSAGKTWAENYYYKISWDLANTTSTNGIICVEKITLFEKAE